MLQYFLILFSGGIIHKRTRPPQVPAKLLNSSTDYINDIEKPACHESRANFSELQEALSLVYQQYRKFGYTQFNEHGLRISGYELLPSSTVFIDTAEDGVCGTVTLIEDSIAGLPADGEFADELNALRAKGRKVAEASMFACEDEAQAGSNAALIGALFNACTGNRIDDLILVVNPKHVAFWHKVLGFDVLANERVCGRICDAPGILLHLDIAEIVAGRKKLNSFASRLLLQSRFGEGSTVKRYNATAKDVLELLKHCSTAGVSIAPVKVLRALSVLYEAESRSVSRFIDKFLFEGQSGPGALI
ncbi:MAG: hypothetical protein J5J00_09850 [Deltaproteobacteria bacterium]|nr:hypothetical protein [Deltaproteobacteria bacterium]